jgi:hypothetical protein
MSRTPIPSPAHGRKPRKVQPAVVPDGSTMTGLFCSVPASLAQDEMDEALRFDT